MTRDQHPRTAGVQLHPTSLPSGRLDDDAYAFVDWLAAAGQSWWQMLPLGPPDRYGSPYKARSAFAAWPGLLADPDAPVSDDEAAAFRERESYWIEGWIELRRPGRPRGPGPLRPRVERAARVRRRARRAARSATCRSTSPPAAPTTGRGPSCSGRVQAGVPPDAFTAEGPALGQPGLRLARVAPAPLPVVGRAAAAHVRDGRHDADRPLPRLRRLLGGAGGRARRRRRPLESAGRARRCSARRSASSASSTSSPRTSASSPSPSSACAGRWASRAWSCSSSASTTRAPRTIPDNHEEHSVVYTGTHDHDTARGWWESLPERAACGGTECVRPRRRARPTTRGGRSSGSPTSRRRRLAMVQLQDVLGLGSEARMNVPGTATGSWRWRLEPGALTEESAARLRASTEEAGR